MSGSETAFAHPAATAVLLRDGDDGCEVLLVRRNAELAFHGGAWVFPGGRIDPEDYDPGAPDDVIAAARRAAVREAREEAGLPVDGGSLVLLSRWITPEHLPKRFDTWFFAGTAQGHDVVIDGGEIQAHRWMSPSAALEAQGRGEIELPPPTFVTLAHLAAYRSSREALAELAEKPPLTFVPRLRLHPLGPCSVYQDDAAYDHDDLERPGPRHRLWLLGTGWRYERAP